MEAKTRYKPKDFHPGCSKLHEPLNEADFRTILAGIAREERGEGFGLDYAYEGEEFEAAMKAMVNLGWMSHHRLPGGRHSMARYITPEGLKIVEEGW